MPGPLSATGTSWTCGSTSASGAFLAAPKTGRWLTIELRGSSVTRLALAEISITGRGEVPAAGTAGEMGAVAFSGVLMPPSCRLPPAVKPARRGRRLLTATSASAELLTA